MYTKRAAGQLAPQTRLGPAGIMRGGRHPAPPGLTGGPEGPGYAVNGTAASAVFTWNVRDSWRYSRMLASSCAR